MDFQPVRLVKGRSTRLPACLVGARAFPLAKFRRWATRCHLAEPFLPDVGTSRDDMLALGAGVFREIKSTRSPEETNCISTVFVEEITVSDIYQALRSGAVVAFYRFQVGAFGVPVQ